MSENILYKQECDAIQGAVFDVYREIGCGFEEPVYQECLEREFLLRNIPFVSQTVHEVSYKGEPLKQTYKSDFVCYDRVIVELKAVREISPEHKAQVINCVKVAGLRLGLLVNFGAYPRATVSRFVL